METFTKRKRFSLGDVLPVVGFELGELIGDFSGIPTPVAILEP